MSGWPLEFRLMVSTSGYFWVKSLGKGKVERATPPQECFEAEFYYLAPKRLRKSYCLATSADSKSTQYMRDVEEHPSLFLDFANVAQTAEGIVEFANQWGFLTDRLGHNQFAKFDDSGLAVQVEPIFVWINAALRINRICLLWEMLRNNDREGLADWVEWISENEVRCGHYVMAGQPVRDMRQGDLLDPVRQYIQDAFTLYDLGGALPNLSTNLIWDRQLGEWRIRLTPPQLLSALSFQLANAVCNDSVFRRCSECGRWLQIAPGSGRPEKTYCSNACRMRAYRKRKSMSVAKRLVASSTVS